MLTLGHESCCEVTWWNTAIFPLLFSDPVSWVSSLSAERADGGKQQEDEEEIKDEGWRGRRRRKRAFECLEWMLTD